MSSDDYNEHELDAGHLKPSHVSELTAFFQERSGLAVDGRCGPMTRALLEKFRTGRIAPNTPVMHRETIVDLVVDITTGWLKPDPKISVIPIHESWYYKHLTTDNGKPKAIVAHYTATDPGTAVAMAKNRNSVLKSSDRSASWHVSIETDGKIIQMAPFTVGCWHAGGPTAKPIAGVGPANRTSVGIELVGYGDVFPSAQVNAAMRLWRALVSAYAIPRERAMVTHSELDPTRKKDPGAIWMMQHAPQVLEHAYK